MSQTVRRALASCAARALPILVLALAFIVPLRASAAAPAFAAPSARDSLPANTWELRLALGVSTGRSQTLFSPLSTATDDDAPLERVPSATGSFTYAITDRLSWSVPVPAFAYRFGTEGQLTAIVRGGLTGIGYSSVHGVVGNIDAGVGARLGAGWVGGPTIRDVSVRASDGTQVPLDDVDNILLFGAVQSLGYRPLPLLQVFVTDWLSIDAYASWAINLDTGGVGDRYLGGFSWAF